MEREDYLGDTERGNDNSFRNLDSGLHSVNWNEDGTVNLILSASDIGCVDTEDTLSLLKTVQKIVDGNRDINEIFDVNKTLLSAAVEANDMESAELLLKHGANSSCLSNLKDSKYQSMDMMRRETPLMTASRLGHVDMCALLLRYGAPVNGGSIVEEDLGSPLHWAANRGHLDVVKLLVEHRADLNARGGHGATALMEAVLEDQFDIVQYLVEAGANINLPLFVSDENVEDEEDLLSDTPLVVSMLLGKDHIVDYLLKSASCFALTHRISDVFVTYTNFLGNARIKVVLSMILLGGSRVTVPALLSLEDDEYIRFKHLRSWLLSFHKTPLCLSQIARITIRRHLQSVNINKGIITYIKRLPLPETLKLFLELDDILN